MKELHAGILTNSIELVNFRKRIGKEGDERIFRMSVGLHEELALEDCVNMDTTAQEKKSPAQQIANWQLRSLIV